MRHKKSVFVEQQELTDAAEAKGYADGLNAALAWLISHEQTELALMMRADFVDQSEHQEPSA